MAHYADEAAIRRAKRSLSLATHPDKVGADTPGANEAFNLVTEVGCCSCGLGWAGGELRGRALGRRMAKRPGASGRGVRHSWPPQLWKYACPLNRPPPAPLAPGVRCAGRRGLPAAVRRGAGACLLLPRLQVSPAALVLLQCCGYSLAGRVDPDGSTGCKGCCTQFLLPDVSLLIDADRLGAAVNPPAYVAGNTPVHSFSSTTSGFTPLPHPTPPLPSPQSVPRGHGGQRHTPRVGGPHGRVCGGVRQRCGGLREGRPPLWRWWLG